MRISKRVRLPRSGAVAVTGLALLALVGCSSGDDVARTTSTVIGATAPSSVSPTADLTMSGDPSAETSETSDSSAGGGTNSAGTDSPGAGASTESATEESSPQILGVGCDDLLTRGQIGSRMGAGFPTKDVFLGVAPDSEPGVLAGLDCQYAVAASGQWTVRAQYIEYGSADQAAARIGATIADRVQQGATSSSSALGDRPIELAVTDGALLMMQLDAAVLSLEIPAGVLDGPRAQVAVTALAEFCLVKIPTVA